MTGQQRASGPETRKERLSLKTWHSRNCSRLAAEQLNSNENLTSLQRFEATLWAYRNQWDISRRTLPADADDWLRGGTFAGRGKLSKDDASRLLGLAMAALNGGDE